MTSSTLGLHRLIYLSSAVGVLRADELDRILLRSKASNGGAGITGLLLFHEGSFLQMIEGPAAGVTSLMQKIRRDRRHTGIVLLQSGACTERIFPDSPLHYVAPRNLSTGEKQAFADLRHAVQARPMLGLPMPHADLGLAAFLDAFRVARPA
jgi:Sensors of blue-light using FAD